MQENFVTAQPVTRTPRFSAFTVALLMSCGVWALVSWWSNANLDSQNDMLENYAWSHSMVLGTHKHPPFFAWVVNLWFEVFPEGDLTYRLLSYANVAVGLWGVRALGLRLGLQQLAAWGALLLLWSFPYTSLAGKFNANTQLLSVWPWAAALWLASWQERGWRGAWFSTWLGLVAAACMLSKYYSGVFLLGFLLPIFLHAQGRQWLLSWRPYWALLVFAAALSPHVWWVAQHEWATLSYVGEQGDGSVNWRYVLRFALAPLFYWLPAWLAVCGCYAVLHARHQGIAAGRVWWRWLWKAWLPQGHDDVLFWLACMPWVLTLLCGVMGWVTLSTPWAIPIGYAFALLWLRNLHALAPVVTAAVLQRLRRAWMPVLAVVCVLGMVSTVLKAWQGDEDYYRPTEDAAHRIVSEWSQRHPGQALSWVGGEWTNNALIAFYVLRDQVRTVPETPDSWAAQVEGMRDWQRSHGLLFCPLGLVEEAGDMQRVPCVQRAQQWLQAQHRPLQPQLITVERHGWRFPKPRAFAYVVFDVPPSPDLPEVMNRHE